MALIKCSECGKEISDKAKVCSNCGTKIKNKENKLPIIICGCIIFVLAIIIILLVITLNTGDNSISSNKANSKTNENVEEKSDGKEGKGFEEDKTETISISKNERITLDGKCEFSITGYTINSVIEPPNPVDYYTYFEADSGNTLVDVKMNIKNLGSSGVSQNTILNSVKIIYDNQYEYSCAFVTEKDNGGDLNNYTTLYNIEPLEELSYHMIAQVPAEVESNPKSIKSIISVNGKEYKCILR